MSRAVIVLLPELAGPWDWLIIAFIGGMLLYAVDTILTRLVIPILGLIPVVGKPLADGLARVVNAAETIVHDWAEARLQPLIDTIKRIDNRLRALARHNTLTHQATLVTLRHIRFDIIPQVQNALIAFIQNRIAAVIAYTQAVAAQLNARMTALSTAQQAYSLALAQQLQLQLAQTRAELLADDRAVITYAQQLTTQAMVRADQEIERAMRALQLDDQLVITYAQQLATQSQAYTRQLVQVEQAQRVAQGADLQTQIATTATAVLTLVLPQLANLARRMKQIEDSPCQQECQTLGQLGQNLDGLDLAALLALLVGLSTHPKEGARAIEDFLGPGAKLASAPLLGLFK